MWKWQEYNICMTKSSRSAGCLKRKHWLVRGTGNARLPLQADIPPERMYQNMSTLRFFSFRLSVAFRIFSSRRSSSLFVDMKFHNWTRDPSANLQTNTRYCSPMTADMLFSSNCLCIYLFTSCNNDSILRIGTSIELLWTSFQRRHYEMMLRLIKLLNDSTCTWFYDWSDHSARPIINHRCSTSIQVQHLRSMSEPFLSFGLLLLDRPRDEIQPLR